jgi:hypothetical protein
MSKPNLTPGKYERHCHHKSVKGGKDSPKNSESPHLFPQSQIQELSPQALAKEREKNID